MLKKNKVLLYLLAIAFFCSILAITILLQAGENPPAEIFGTVSYPDPRLLPDVTDRVYLCEYPSHDTIKSVGIQGGGGKHWYNALIPDASGYYYVWGKGENCSSNYYLVYWEIGDRLEQDVVMDLPNMQQSPGR